MPSTRIHRRAHSALSLAGLLILSILILTPAAGHSEPMAKVTADRIEIIKKLLDYQFDALDSELTAYEQKAESDPRFEMNAIVAFAAFDTPMPLIVDRVKDWRNAKPNSYAAALARAISLTATGVRWRGNGWAKDVPDANFAKMNESVRDAVNAENSALALDPNLASAYALRIRAARLAGSGDELSRAAGEALKRCPASFAVREQIMYAMRPRWGGSREAMQKLADQSQQYAAQNPSMRFLKAWLPGYRR